MIEPSQAADAGERDASHVDEHELGGTSKRSPSLKLVIEPLAFDSDWEIEKGGYPGRANCPKQRPCPKVGCRFHNWLVEPESRPGRRHQRAQGGAPTVSFRPATGTTCALDVAARGRQTFSDIGAVLGVSDERARMLYERALRKIAALGVSMDEMFPEEHP